MSIQNKVNLITYPDSLGSNLLELHYVLRRYLEHAVGGVHLLPFYPSSADRGFSPLTYDEVDPAFGTWGDIEMIGRDFDLTLRFHGQPYLPAVRLTFKTISKKARTRNTPICFSPSTSSVLTVKSMRKSLPKSTPANRARRSPWSSAPTAPGKKSGAHSTTNRSTSICSRPLLRRSSATTSFAWPAPMPR
jgi:hypothetical protein